SLAVAAVLGSGGVVFAQQGGGGPRRGADTEQTPPPPRNPQARQNMLERFDADGDGQLSDSERAAAFDATLEERPALKQRLLQRFDEDKDGKLNETEKAAARESVQGRRGTGDGAGAGPRGGPGAGMGRGPGADGAPGGGPRFQGRMLEEIDTDGDGKLSDTEIETLRAEVAAWHAERLQRLDKDGDG